MKGRNNFKGKFSPFVICSNGLDVCASSLFKAFIFCEMEGRAKLDGHVHLEELLRWLFVFVVWVFLFCFLIKDEIQDICS